MGAITLSTNDLKKSCLRHCGEVDDGTSYYDQNGQVLDYLNKAHMSILGGGNEFNVELSKPWSWAMVLNPGVVILQPPYISGGVSVTNGSRYVQFDTPPNFSLANYRLQLLDRVDYMKIISHQPGQQTAIIDAPYADLTGAGLPYQAILIDYKLSPTPNGILRLTQAMTVYHPQDLQGDEEQKIYYCDENQMDRDYPLKRIIGGTPNLFTITLKDPNGNYWVKFEKSVQLQTRVEYKYIEIPAPLVDSTTNYPLIPVEHRDCLDFAASYFLLTDKNDDRAQMFFQLTQQKLSAMQKSEEKQKTQASKNKGKLFARGDLYQRGKRFAVQETS